MTQGTLSILQNTEPGITILKTNLLDISNKNDHAKHAAREFRHLQLLLLSLAPESCITFIALRKTLLILLQQIHLYTRQSLAS